MASADGTVINIDEAGRNDDRSERNEFFKRRRRHDC
jgi:hypothetical protein